MRLENNINKIKSIMGVLNEQPEPDHTKQITNFLNKTFVPKNEEVCGVVVVNPKDRKVLMGQPPYEKYKVTIYFIGGPKTKYWPKTQAVASRRLDIMDELHSSVMNFFNIYVDIYEKNITNCDSFENVTSRIDNT